MTYTFHFWRDLLLPLRLLLLLLLFVSIHFISFHLLVPFIRTYIHSILLILFEYNNLCYAKFPPRLKRCETCIRTNEPTNERISIKKEYMIDFDTDKLMLLIWLHYGRMCSSNSMRGKRKTYSHSITFEWCKLIKLQLML